jgi:hypothetical protein
MQRFAHIMVSHKFFFFFPFLLLPHINFNIMGIIVTFSYMCITYFDHIDSPLLSYSLSPSHGLLSLIVPLLLECHLPPCPDFTYERKNIIVIFLSQP